MGNSEISDANNEDVVDVTPPDGTPPDSEQNASEKWKREVKVRSRAWLHFTKLEKKDGKKDQCRCNYCKNLFSCPLKGGTSLLLCHIDDRNCPIYIAQKGDKSQTLLSYAKESDTQDSNLVPWKFDQDRSRSDLIELIIVKELPSNFVEDATIGKYIWGIYPKYKFVSRNTMKSDCMKRYQTERNILKDLPYMALTAHFIDEGWRLHKRIINFVMLPIKATGENMVDIIVSCTLEWNVEKICTSTMDNASSNGVLARTLCEYYSSRGLLLVEGSAIQVCCWGHILNLIVKEGLDEIKDSILRVRNAVKYVKASPKRKVEFLQYVDNECIPQSKMLVLDVSTRWNSTYSMLDVALHYKRAYGRMQARDSNFKDPPTLEDWERAEIVHVFLESFYIATNIFSGSKYCTSNLFFREMYMILMLLRETSKDLTCLLGMMVFNMLVKFEKYWVEKEPNILLSIAAVLEPRFKLKYLLYCYQKIYDDYMVSGLMGRVEEVLRELFNGYLAAYNVSCRKEVNSYVARIVMLSHQLLAHH